MGCWLQLPLNRMLATMSAITSLRKRHGFLSALKVGCSCGGLLMAATAMSTAQQGDGGHRVNGANGLLLYYHHYSFYSQKVVMALHEKRLPFDSHIVNITKGEQYQSWYLKINPRGEVPVLQDDGKIVPDSARIIDYLEDNFSNGDTPRLIPLDQGPEIRQQVTHFRNIIDKLPAGIITMGSFYHPELVKNPKIPFVAPVRKLLANAEKNSSTLLREVAENNPEAREILLQKASVQDIKHETVVNIEEYVKVLDQVDEVLEEVENELKKHKEGKELWWLCSDRFTVADVALTVLLERLNGLGLEHRFWSDGKRPHVQQYYDRVKQRDSYRKTIPSVLTHVKTLVNSQTPTSVGISIGTAVALLVGGILLIKKLVR